MFNPNSGQLPQMPFEAMQGAIAQEFTKNKTLQSYVTNNWNAKEVVELNKNEISELQLIFNKFVNLISNSEYNEQTKKCDSFIYTCLDKMLPSTSNWLRTTEIQVQFKDKFKLFLDTYISNLYIQQTNNNANIINTSSAQQINPQQSLYPQSSQPINPQNNVGGTNNLLSSSTQKINKNVEEYVSYSIDNLQKDCLKAITVNNDEYYIEENKMRQFCKRLIDMTNKLPISDQIKRCNEFIYLKMIFDANDSTIETIKKYTNMKALFRTFIIEMIIAEQVKRIGEHFKNHDQKLPDDLNKIEEALSTLGFTNEDSQNILRVFQNSLIDHLCGDTIKLCKEELHYDKNSLEKTFKDAEQSIAQALARVNISPDSELGRTLETYLRNDIIVTFFRPLLGEFQAQFSQSGSIDRYEFEEAARFFSVFCTKSTTEKGKAISKPLPCTINLSGDVPKSISLTGKHHLILAFPNESRVPLFLRIEQFLLTTLFNLSNNINFDTWSFNINQQIQEESKKSSFLGNIFSFGTTPVERLQNQLKTIEWAKDVWIYDILRNGYNMEPPIENAPNNQISNTNIQNSIINNYNPSQQNNNNLPPPNNNIQANNHPSIIGNLPPPPNNNLSNNILPPSNNNQINANLPEPLQIEEIIEVSSLQPTEPKVYTAKDNYIPLISYIEVIFPGTHWDHLPEIIKRDALRHAFKCYLCQGTAEQHVSQINGNNKLNMQDAFEKTSKDLSVWTGLSGEFMHKGFELLEIYYGKKSWEFHGKLQQLPKEDRFLRVVRAMAIASGIKVEDWDTDFAKHNLQHSGMQHIALQALEACLHISQYDLENWLDTKGY